MWTLLSNLAKRYAERWPPVNEPPLIDRIGALAQQPAVQRWACPLCHYALWAEGQHICESCGSLLHLVREPKQ